MILRWRVDTREFSALVQALYRARDQAALDIESVKCAGPPTLVEQFQNHHSTLVHLIARLESGELEIEN